MAGELISEEPLQGGRMTPGVVRIGATVRRPIHGDPTFRHALLRHLEAVGFEMTPRVLGIDEEGREILTYLEGNVPHHFEHFNDAQIEAAAVLLRRYHDATAGTGLAGGGEVVCHNDWVPNNAVFQGELPVGMIDFDSAAPGTRLWDLGHVAWEWLDLGDPTYSAEKQLRRLELFAAAYDWRAAAGREIAIHAVARQLALAAWGERHGRPEIEAKGRACAAWTSAYLVEALITCGLRQP